MEAQKGVAPHQPVARRRILLFAGITIAEKASAAPKRSCFSSPSTTLRYSAGFVLRRDERPRPPVGAG